MVWKSGDVTWMPYYQIRHLRAFVDYLKLLGVDDVSRLPAGRGNPPQDDPQIFLGAISHDLLGDDLKGVLDFSDFLDTLLFPFALYFFYPDPELHNQQTLSVIMGPLRGVRHPAFTQISATQYSISNPDGRHCWNVHVGQIMNYLAFDSNLRTYGVISNSGTIPLGYNDFQIAWNTGIHPEDTCRISTFTPGKGDQVNICEPSVDPVTLIDFFITPEQCGMPKRRNKREEARALIFEDYAASQAWHKIKLQGYYNQRESKQQEKFGFSHEKRRFDQIDDNTSLYEESAELSLFNMAAGTSPFISQPAAGSSTSTLLSPVRDEFMLDH